jgi:hypothetical protein
MFLQTFPQPQLSDLSPEAPGKLDSLRCIETYLPQINRPQIHQRKVSTPQIRSGKTAVAQVCPGHVRVAQVRFLETCPIEIGLCEFDTAEIHPFQVLMTRDEVRPVSTACGHASQFRVRKDRSQQPTILKAGDKKVCPPKRTVGKRGVVKLRGVHASVGEVALLEQAIVYPYFAEPCPDKTAARKEQ